MCFILMNSRPLVIDITLLQHSPPLRPHQLTFVHRSVLRLYPLDPTTIFEYKINRRPRRPAMLHPHSIISTELDFSTFLCHMVQAQILVPWMRLANVALQTSYALEVRRNWTMCVGSAVAEKA